MSTERLESEGFPLCCRASILYGFPEGDRSARSMVADERKVRKEVQSAMDDAFLAGHATIVVILNSDQKLAAKVLEDMGWHSSAPMKKMNQRANIYKHDRRIQLWWCQLDEYEWVNE